MLSHLQEVIEYLNENMSDPVPQYILNKEIRNSPTFMMKSLYESKWYKQLATEQWQNGSWGRFHTQDTKSISKQKFTTTENALRRALELSLDKNDEMIHNSIQLMERYIEDQEAWLDINEHHENFHIAFKTLIAANLSLFDPKNSLVQAKKEVCAECISKAFKNGSLDEAVWEEEYKKNREIYLKPFTVYIVWLLQNNEFLDSAIEREFLTYIWNRNEGIYYRTDCSPLETYYLESKKFSTWLTSLETLSAFSLFPDFMHKGISTHLLNEIHRLMNHDITLPNSHSIFSHYSESWSKKQYRKNDMILRILRILVKC